MKEHLIPFHQDQIIAFSDNDRKLIAVKPVCESFQIDWSAQFKKLNNDQLFKPVIAMIATTGADGKQYQMICLPLELFPIWLAKIDINRIKNELAKEKILLYQKEAAKVLYEYFLGGKELPAKQIAEDKYIALLEENRGILNRYVNLLESTTKKRKRSRPFSQISDAEKEKMIKLHKEGMAKPDIAQRVQRSTSSVHFILKGAGLV